MLLSICLCLFSLVCGYVLHPSIPDFPWFCVCLGFLVQVSCVCCSLWKFIICLLGLSSFVVFLCVFLCMFSSSSVCLLYVSRSCPSLSYVESPIFSPLVIIVWFVPSYLWLLSASVCVSVDVCLFISLPMSVYVWPCTSLCRLTVLVEQPVCLYVFASFYWWFGLQLWRPLILDGRWLISWNPLPKKTPCITLSSLLSQKNQSIEFASPLSCEGLCIKLWFALSSDIVRIKLWCPLSIEDRCIKLWIRLSWEDLCIKLPSSLS